MESTKKGKNTGSQESGKFQPSKSHELIAAKSKPLKFLITKKPKDKKSFEYYIKAIKYLLQRKNTEVFIESLCLQELKTKKEDE